MSGSVIPAPGDHGGDGPRIAAALGVPLDDVLDLSASLNPVAPDISSIVVGHLDALGRYPDHTGATAALACRLGVDPDRVLLTNGGAEAIGLVGAELGGQVDEPDFSLYPRRPAADGAVARWRSNPHSPSGRLAPDDAVADVWDEAFWPLATGTWTRGDAERGSVVVGSLTKLLACPGLRVGYVLVPDDRRDLLARVRERQPAWSVNGLVCESLPSMLEDADLRGWAGEVGRLRAALVDTLAGHGLATDAADAPWVLVHHAPDLRDRLARQGVVVRDCGSFGLPGTVRIAVPDDADRTRLARALEASR